MYLSELFPTNIINLHTLQIYGADSCIQLSQHLNIDHIIYDLQHGFREEFVQATTNPNHISPYKKYCLK